MQLLSSAWRRRGDERGSLIVGMSIMMVVVVLSSALVARAIGSLNSVRRTQDFSAALASADGGLADFLFALDQEPVATTLTASGTLGDGGYTWVAKQVGINEWQVESIGTVNGVPHAIEATVQRDADYPYAIFTNQDLNLNGNGGLNIYSYNSTTGATDTGNAYIGSNRDISVTGGGGGDGQHFYTPDGSCTNCPNPEQQDGPLVLDDPEVPTSGQACPTGGVFGAVIDGGNGNPIICDADVVFPATTITLINKPVIIYVKANRSVTLVGASINETGAGADFRLLKAGNGAMNVGNGASAARVNGVIYAPSTDLVVNGGQMHLDGSLTVNSLTVNGDPNFEFRFDDSILSIVSGTWRVTDWQEIPSGDFGF